jgi:hypothetical protein
MIYTWTERRMQLDLTKQGNLFDFTRYAVVPNVSYSVLYQGEADLLCLSKGNIFHEVEIKISVQDMKNEGKKRKSQYSNVVAYKWIAAPEEIADKALELECIPKTWGVVSVSAIWVEDIRWYSHVEPAHWVIKTKKLRNPKRQETIAISESKIVAFYIAGITRMWSKRKNED